MAKKHVHELLLASFCRQWRVGYGRTVGDACTQKEIEAIHQRFLVAQMLKDGYTFVEIEK